MRGVEKRRIESQRFIDDINNKRLRENFYLNLKEFLFELEGFILATPIRKR